MALPFPPPPRFELPPERFELFLPMWILYLFAHSHDQGADEVSASEATTRRTGEWMWTNAPTGRCLLNPVQKLSRDLAIFST